jgi:hypothetical protein
MLTGTLTHCDVNLRKAVDYVPEYLINENFATIEKVIYHFYCQIREKDVMLAEMEKTKHYLKYGFDIGIVNAKKVHTRIHTRIHTRRYINCRLIDTSYLYC